MNEITNPNTVKFISPNAGLVYTFFVNEEKKEKGTLKFTPLGNGTGICELDSKDPVAKAAIAKWEAQWETKEGKKVIKGDNLPVPFTPFDEFQASIVRTPVRIELGAGKYFEITPEEIQAAVAKAEKFDALQAKKEKK